MPYDDSIAVIFGSGLGRMATHTGLTGLLEGASKATIYSPLAISRLLGSSTGAYVKKYLPAT